MQFLAIQRNNVKQLFCVGFMICFWSTYFTLGCFFPCIPLEWNDDKVIEVAADSYELGQLRTFRDFSLKGDYKIILENKKQFKKIIKKQEKK